MIGTTALVLRGRDALPLLHRTTTNALAELMAGSACATLFCDFRGRLQHRAVVAVASDGAVWLLRADAPGSELAATVDRMVFRDDVQIEDRSRELPLVLAIAPPGAQGVLEERSRVPFAVATGDGTLLAFDGRAALSEPERIARLLPRHGHEIAEAFNPFEVGLGHEVHLDKGCFTGQEALQRLVTYGGVRRRPVHVRLSAPTGKVPVDLFAGGVRAGVLTSVAGREGIAVLREEPLSNRAEVSLADGTSVRVLAAPDPSRPLGRP